MMDLNSSVNNKDWGNTTINIDRQLMNLIYDIINDIFIDV